MLLRTHPFAGQRCRLLAHTTCVELLRGERAYGGDINWSFLPLVLLFSCSLYFKNCPSRARTGWHSPATCQLFNTLTYPVKSTGGEGTHLLDGGKRTAGCSANIPYEIIRYVEDIWPIVMQVPMQESICCPEPSFLPSHLWRS